MTPLIICCDTGAMSDRAQGFWSYVHEDDENEGGRIRRLAESLRNEYALMTGGTDP
jgi:hypothetical protein